MKLTTTSIRSLALPKGVQEKTFFDDALPAFGVRVRSSGSKSYVVQYKVGSQHRHFRGTYRVLAPGREQV